MMSLATLLLATMAEQGPCEALKSLSIPNTTITASENVPAGPQRNARGDQSASLPAHCRVTAVLQPSPDSHIEMELWMPSENWNGKFVASRNPGRGRSEMTRPLCPYPRWPNTPEPEARTTRKISSARRGKSKRRHNRSHDIGAGFFIHLAAAV
jgi:hypothetical protein